MSKFKVGDKVRFTDACSSMYWFGPHTKFKTGIVSRINHYDDYDVNVDGGADRFNEGIAYVGDSEIELIPDALTIQAGKFYRTRDGRKVGPMRRTRCEGAWTPDGGRHHYLDDGSRRFGEDDGTVILAEWVEPAVAPATATPTAKFKVGDRVENAIRGNDYTKPGTVTEVLRDDAYRIAWDDNGWLDKTVEWYDHELRLVAPAPTTSAIVALIENGQPKPAHRPYVHSSRQAAEADAARLAGEHPGKDFGVYELVATKREAKVYDFEWQRLASGGEKIGAIKSLRSITGLISLRSARNAVEDFIDQQAA